MTVFFGRSFGICLRPRLEQSTTAPEAEQEQGAGQASTANVVLTTKINDKITTKCRKDNIVEKLFFSNNFRFVISTKNFTL